LKELISQSWRTDENDFFLLYQNELGNDGGMVEGKVDDDDGRLIFMWEQRGQRRQIFVCRINFYVGNGNREVKVKYLSVGILHVVFTWL
jgi:hypothetical protein